MVFRVNAIMAVKCHLHLLFSEFSVIYRTIEGGAAVMLEAGITPPSVTVPTGSTGKGVVMEPESDAQELYLTQTENRHLKDTISVLREELEKMRIDHETNIRNALLSADSEILQLKSTIVALRDELERIQIRHDEKIQHMEQMAGDEMNQLQQTVKTLRQQLEEHERERR